ncbi:serine protease 1-like isoform X3 [Schistocerca nitens]|uniref:serine protease 1-like isoform X3 n=1 Tax=Schistocerca nitens TaxID=7011 RepID=UPI0021190324|nr:serine protease 1-like isoform X3 [Schistocerca nitens]
MAARVLFLLLSVLLVVTAKLSTSKLEKGTAPKEGNGRITDGHPAGVGQFPYQALIIADGGDIWGGSLITTRAVLTASYCTTQYQTWTVRLGGIHRSQDESTAWIVESSYAQSRPESTAMVAGAASYDVGVIFLPSEAPLNRYIQLVTLPSSLEVDDTYEGQTGVLAGWGITEAGETEVLLWSQVTVVPNSVCSELHEEGAITDNIMCAANTYTGICWADLGTPLVLETEGGYKQIGVAGFLPTDGCVTGVPAGFVRVTSALDWIATITATNVQ